MSTVRNNKGEKVIVAGLELAPGQEKLLTDEACFPFLMNTECQQKLRDGVLVFTTANPKQQFMLDEILSEGPERNKRWNR